MQHAELNRTGQSRAKRGQDWAKKRARLGQKEGQNRGKKRAKKRAKKRGKKRAKKRAKKRGQKLGQKSPATCPGIYIKYYTVVKDFLKEVFDNIGLISYASSNFIHFRKFPQCERSEPLFPLNFLLKYYTVPQISPMRAQRAPVPQ
jgi:hypothetical protein